MAEPRRWSLRTIAPGPVLVGLLALTAPAEAVIGTVDDVPAATLLLPYFEVDLDSATGVNTLFSINNAFSTAILAHVVIWSDLSVPVLQFDIYLTGYDSQSVNLRDVLVGGVVPRTASAGQDPLDQVSRRGRFSQDIDFESCAGKLPPPALPASLVADVQAALTGRFSSALGGCAARNLNSRIARGYITVDTVNKCSLRFPSDDGYFGVGGSGDATNQNVLFGDYFYANPGQNLAGGETLVAIEASEMHPETSFPGQYTFYGRYVRWLATDNREPLAGSFGARYFNAGAFSSTDLICWRDSKIPQRVFGCSARPSWFPLGQEGFVIFDEAENPVAFSPFPWEASPLPEQYVCPAAAQRVKVDGAELPVPDEFGWLFLNLNRLGRKATWGPPEDNWAAQAWVTVVMDAAGRFNVGFEAIQLDNSTKALHGVPPFD